MKVCELSTPLCLYACAYEVCVCAHAYVYGGGF